MSSMLPNFVKKMMSGVGMGSENCILPNFPYELDELLLSRTETGGIWTVHRGHHLKKLKGTDDRATIFIFDNTRNPSGLPVARNFLKRLKTLRHPHLLKYITSAESENTIAISTEPVIPLSHKIEEMRRSPDSMLWIVNLLLKALKFLNSEAGIIHGNLRVSSMFVTEAGELKLGGLDIASNLKENEGIICEFDRYLSDASVRDWPPELSSPSAVKSWRQIQSLPPWTIDSYMLSSLLCQMFANGKIPSEINQFIKLGSLSDFRKRPDPATLLGGRAFENVQIIGISEKFDLLSAMDFEERERFFAYVNTHSNLLPTDFLKYKVVPSLALLFNAVASSQSSTQGIKLLLSSAGNLSASEIQRIISPILATLFSKPDRSIRIALLESLPGIVDSLDSKFIQESLYPHLLSGFTDALPVLRETTLKTSLLLAPKISNRQLNGELLRFYAKLQSDPQPGIRVNTIVCLGRIASLLDDGTRNKVLGMAYIKALLDPFIPSKIAALSAILTTGDFISIEEVARNLLPTITPLLVENDPEVRNLAFKVANKLMKRLENHSTTIPSPTTQTSHYPPSTSDSKNDKGDKTIRTIKDGLKPTLKEKDSIPGKMKQPDHPSSFGTKNQAPVRTAIRKLSSVEPPVTFKPIIQNESSTDGWNSGIDDLDLDNIDISEKNENINVSRSDDSNIWQDDDNPWMSTDDKTNQVDIEDPWSSVNSPTNASPSVVYPIKGDPTPASKPMSLGRTRTNLIDLL